jgi:hypothetical protein
LKNERRVKKHTSNIYIAPFNTPSKGVQGTYKFESILDNSSAKTTRNVNVDVVFKESLACCIVDMRYFPKNPNFLDDYYRWKHMMEELRGLHSPLFDCPIWMFICSYEQEQALIRMEKIVFPRYDVKMVYYQSGVGETGFNPYSDKLTAIHYVLHPGDDMLGLHSGLKQMGDYQFPKSISVPLGREYNKRDAYKERSLADYDSELRMEVYLQFMIKAFQGGGKLCGLLFAGKKPLAAAVVS